MSGQARARKHLVQIAANWPTSHDGWETLPEWTASSARKSIAGNGSAAFTANYGLKVDAAAGKAYRPIIPNPSGKWCRIIVQDDFGDITINAEKFSPVWHGIMGRRRLSPNAAALPTVKQSIEAKYITAAFEAIDILGSWELDYKNDLVFSYKMPIFNTLEGGDMSSSPADLDGFETKVFERSAERTPAQWTYAEALQYICASARPKIPTSTTSGPQLIPGIIPDALASAPLPKNSGKGKNVIECLRSIFNYGIGVMIAFRVDSETFSIYIDVIPCAQSDTNLYNGGIVVGTIPNAFTGTGASPTAIDIFDDPWVRDVEITEDDDAQDYILCVGGSDSYGITLEVTDAIEPCEWELTTDPGDPADDPYDDAWRLWKIRADWLGEQYDAPGEGLPATIVHGPNGTESLQFGGDHPANATMDFGRDLPWGVSDALGSRTTPKLFIGPPAGQTVWTDVSNKISITPLKDGLIRLGQTKNDGQILKQAYENGQTILLSIGIDAWYPLLKAWRRNAAGPRDLPRVMRLDLPGASTETGLVGTAKAVDENGDLTTETEEQVREADVDGLRNYLSTTVAKNSNTNVSLSLTVKGTLAERYKLGEPILSLSFGKTTQKTTVSVKSCITSLLYNFSESDYGITYEATPIQANG